MTEIVVKIGTWFLDAYQAIRKYIDYYNTERTKDKLKELTPIEYRNKSLVA